MEFSDVVRQCGANFWPTFGLLFVAEVVLDPSREHYRRLVAMLLLVLAILLAYFGIAVVGLIPPMPLS